MQPNRMPLLAAFAALLAVAGLTGWYSWQHRTQEFFGTLKSNVDAIGIPESPPTIAYLITPSGRYALSFPSYKSWQLRPKLIDELTRMDGKEVIVRGKLEVWRDKYQGNRHQQRIRVDDMQLSPQCATTAPGNG